MKVSEITVQNVADYLRLETGEYTTSDLNTLLGIAKTFIKSYTGIKDQTITGETVGTGDGEETEFKLSNSSVINSTIEVYVNGVLKVKDTDYYFDFANGKITFITAPVDGDVITADYQTGIDAFDEFVIVVYILCQDMHDNRTMYVEKSNINKVYQSILDMHCVNLL